MASKDRKLRAFIEREQRFLMKARELIKQDGLLKLQMQRVADACDYSVGTLYLHFKSKEDMLLGLLTQSVEDRLKLFNKVSQWQACTRDRLLGFVFADLLFAQRDPLFFQLHQYLSTPVIAAAITPERHTVAIETHQPLADLFMEVIEEAIDNGDVCIKHITPLQFGLGLWALCEGIHTLAHADGLSEAYRVSSPYSLLLHHAHALLNGHNWQPLYSLDDIEQQEALLLRLFKEVLTDFSANEFKSLLSTATQGCL